MKKFLKTLVVGLCLFTLLYCALPAAFAADKTSGSKKEENVYAIGMDAQGGICSTVVTYTNLSGKLESMPPSTPTGLPRSVPLLCRSPPPSPPPPSGKSM